ncbi:MAG: starch-binding protein [Lachnospiraceae bacterium]|nr:starch-binding protein [Lachnospiraceae bacterium]
MAFKKSLSVLLSLATVSTAAAVVGTASAAEVEQEPVGNSYGLCDNIQDGVILHCFDWKYNDIKAELPNIAEAGFTSIQTSPAQKAEDLPDWGNAWFKMYQPQNFSISTSVLGTKEDLKALCEAADEYGIKIVVDVVGNHLRGNGYDVDSNLSRGSRSDFYHGWDGGIDYNNRDSITHGDLGMADLNTENAELQQIEANYIKELQSVGVDGIRWDAAKHIGLPSEGSDFWRVVTEQGLWHYGEILDQPGGDSERLMKEYTDYISVTDSNYGKDVRNATENGGVPGTIGNWCNRGISKNKLVYWAESHDTYSNNGEYGEASQFIPQDKVDRAWAIVAAQGDATALYFSRPSQTDKYQIMTGEKGSTHFTEAAVAEVNKFHNAMVGKKDYYSHNGSVASVTREGGGAVIVNGSGSGDVSIANGGGYCPEGTYTDAVSGGTFTVTSTTISGSVGQSGIAVLYDSSVVVTGAKVTATPGDSSFTTNTIDVTLSVKNASTGTYTTSEGASGSFTDGQKITIGANTNLGGTVTVTLKATGEDGNEVSKTYKYMKKDPNAVTSVYFDNSSYNWSDVYVYIYKDKSNNAAWPGVKMTRDSATGYFKYDVPDDFVNGAVMFSDGTGSDTNRYPADQQPGLELEDTTKLFSAGNKWEAYSPVIDTDSDTESDTDSEETVTVILGDVNDDGKVNLRDAALAQKAAAGVVSLDKKATAAADVTGDGKIRADDCVEIQRYDIKLQTSHEVGKRKTIAVS